MRSTIHRLGKTTMLRIAALNDLQCAATAIGNNLLHLRPPVIRIRDDALNQLRLIDGCRYEP
jgi:hypothetical protein